MKPLSVTRMFECLCVTVRQYGGVSEPMAFDRSLPQHFCCSCLHATGRPRQSYDTPVGIHQSKQYLECDIGTISNKMTDIMAESLRRESSFSGNHLSKRFFIERRLICQFTFQFLKYSLHGAFTPVDLADSAPGMYPQTTMEPSIFDSRQYAWEGISHFRLETRIHVVSDMDSFQNGRLFGRVTLAFLLANAGKMAHTLHVGGQSRAAFCLKTSEELRRSAIWFNIEPK